MIYISGTKDIHLENSAVALGKFDGLHKGHQLLIKKLQEFKKLGYTAVMFTFDFHPFNITKKEKIELIYTSEERRHFAEMMGMDVLVEYPFNEETAHMEPEDFIRDILMKKVGAKVIVAGDDFRFGYNRRGNAQMLRDLEEAYGYQADICEKIQVEVPTFINGRTVFVSNDIGSTMIRETLRKGNVEFANELLGRPFSVIGKVSHGRKLGRTMGMPTANLEPSMEKLLPPNGVYISKTLIEGKIYESVTNIGRNPTIAENNARRVETYLFGYDGDLYGKLIEVELYKHQRLEMKFETIDALKAQMEKDLMQARAYFQTLRDTGSEDK